MCADSISIQTWSSKESLLRLWTVNPEIVIEDTSTMLCSTLAITHGFVLGYNGLNVNINQLEITEPGEI